MIELECSNEACGNVVCCDEGVVSVTCSYCCVIFDISEEESVCC